MALKILILSHNFYPDIGGIESISIMFAEEFLKLGHKVRIVTWSQDPSNKVFSYTVVRNPSSGRLIYEHIWADVIFENNICIRLAWPNFFLAKPSIIGLQTWINGTDGKVGWKEWMKLRWLSLAGQVIACSNAIRERCWPESIVIGNPYQEGIFKELSEVERNTDFIFLGRLVSDKGADFAIQAFYNLLQNGGLPNSNELNLTIVGDGPEREKLHRMVERLRLGNRINFKGALRGEELVHCLNQHRFLVVPSLWEEPFGIVALEGMACGCLPIVSDGGGLPDAVGKAGLVFRKGNIDDLTRCMREVLENPYLYETYKDQMQAHLKSHYSSAVSQQYLSIIDKLV